MVLPWKFLSVCVLAQLNEGEFIFRVSLGKIWRLIYTGK